MYKIANKNIDILNIKENQSLSRLVPFSVKENNIDTVDTVYEVQYQQCLDIPSKEEIFYIGLNLVVVKTSNSMRYYHTYNNVPHAMTEEFDKSRYKIHLLDSIKEYTIDHDVDEYYFLDLMHIDRLLIEDGFFVLHSSYIEYDGGAILFTAPSGGGKSTQAELWKKYKGARIINGDKSIIGKKNGEWYVYGIPFSGSSNDCLNESYPLKAVVILSKAAENNLVEVGMRGFQPLLSQITLNRWDREFCNTVINSVSDMCTEVPIYYYACTKETEAVDVLYHDLVRKGAIDGTFE